MKILYAQAFKPSATDRYLFVLFLFSNVSWTEGAGWSFSLSLVSIVIKLVNGFFDLLFEVVNVYQSVVSEIDMNEPL